MSEATQEKPEKKVRIKLLRDALVGGEIRKAGGVVEATEAEAAELCDRKFAGYHPIYGYTPEVGNLMNDELTGEAPTVNPIARKQIVRAQRVK